MTFKAILRATAIAGAIGAMTLFAGGADAQDKKVSMKMGSAFPGKLVQLGSLGKNIPVKAAAVSGGTLDIKFFEPNALVPPLQMFDAISKGSLDAAWSTPGYYIGKIPALAFFSAVPFGPAAGEYLAWFYYGGGKQLFEGILAEHKIHSMMCGIIAPEASGWFRKEIKSVEDLKGLKMRFFGLGAKVMQKMGVSTQLLAAGDIYPALERGTIDATEFSMPAIDLNLGFYQVAKHYYFPGWHQQSTLFDMMISDKKWNEMSKTQRVQLEMACGDNIREGIAEGEAIQGKALADLKAKGVQFHRWPKSILDTLEKAWDEVVVEESAKDATFKKVHESYATFRKGYQIWKDLGYL